MNNKTAVLIQAHKESEYIKQLALQNSDVNFYLHFDAKSNIKVDDYSIIPNILVLSERVNVKWGGFSQVEATLLLLKKAFENPHNTFFHLISGEDCVLKPFYEISQKISITTPEIYIDLRYSLKHRHRTRFWAIHANTVWQRSFLGKVLTKFNVLLDKILPISQVDDILYSTYGSQWFSINRLALEMLLLYTSKQEVAFFFKRLVPDEHFFQYILERFNLKQYNQSDNRRFIDLPDNKNHPRYIELDELKELAKQDYWMARKVKENTLLTFLRGQND